MKHKILVCLIFFYFLAVVSYLFMGALSYKSAWMHSENVNSFTTTALELSGNKLTYFKDYLRVFDLVRFENGEPRPTRPLSNLLSIINSKLRSKLWQYIPPHPSLNLGIFISLIFIPFCLFKLLKGLHFSSLYSFLFMSFYMISPASISDFSQNFRPAKTMVNLCILLALLWGQRLNNKFKKDIHISWNEIILLTLFFFQSFLWDETGFLVLLSFIVFFPRLLLRKKIVFSLLISPLLILCCYFLLFPYIGKILHYPPFPLLKYDHLQNPLNQMMEYKKYFFLNMSLLVSDSFGFHFRPEIAPSFWPILFSINFFLFLFFSILLIHQLFFKKFNLTLSTQLIFLIALALLHTYLMTSNRWHAHGIYYYGNYWSIFFVLFVAGLFHKSFKKNSTPVALAFILLMGPGLVYKTHHFNLLRKFTHSLTNFPPDEMIKYLKDEKSRYELTKTFSFYTYQKTKEVWKNIYQAKDHFDKKEIDENYFSAEIIADLFPDQPEILNQLHSMRGMYEKLRPTQLQSISQINK